MAGLLLAFAGQTALVYGDTTAHTRAKLGPLAKQGRGLWHRHNCQACHQLYGFGGFLGPDLTNAASRVNRVRLDEVLTRGSLQMPAFHLTSGEIDALEAFLRTLDATGVGQARSRIPVSATRIDAVVDDHACESPMTDAALRGRDLFRARCNACHMLFRATPLGPFLAPDLCGVTERLGAAELRAVLTDGRPERGMPPPGLTAPERDAITAYLQWLCSHQTPLRMQVGDGEAVDGLPWFEYR